MAGKEKRVPASVAKPMAEPVLVVKRKSRGRRYAEITLWSVLVFFLYFSYRTNIVQTIGAFLSPAFQAPLRHTPDYSLGFLPRVLSGQLLTFFTGGSVTGPTAGAYFLALFVITYGLLSLILGALVEKAISAKNYLIAMFPLLIIFAPQAVWIRSFSYEHFETLMFLFALAAFLLSKNEKLMWAVPVCVCLGIMASESFMLLFFPLVFALLYYEFIKGGMKRTRFCHLIATTVTSFALEIYMLWVPFHSELVSKYSFADSIAYLERKIGRVFVEESQYLHFIGGVFGRILDGRNFPLINVNVWQFDYFQPMYYVIALAFCAPILIFTLAIWWKQMKSEKGFWRKSPYVLFMLAPLVLFPAFLVFEDMDRLTSAVLLTQVLWVVYLFFSNGQSEAFIRMEEIGAGKSRWLSYAAVLLGVIVPLLVFRGPYWLVPSFDNTALVNILQEFLAGN